MLECQKDHFDLPDDISYLNCAYMGPMLKAAKVAGMDALKKRMQPFNYQRDDFFKPVEVLKSSFASLINADSSHRIAIIPSVSYGIANAARNIDFSKKKTILLVSEQFPSNVYVWQKVAEEKGANLKIIAQSNPASQSPEQWNQNIINAINHDTAVLAAAHVHWADGTLFDLIAIREKLDQVEAALIIDGTQSIGALPFDVEAFRPDALICGSYKWMFGPYGLGLAYYGSYFDNGTPIEENWINRKDSHLFEKLVDYQSLYKPEAARYSVGEHSNFIYLPMLQVSLNQILEWQPSQIQQYCKSLLLPYLEDFKNLGCSVSAPEHLAFHLVGLGLPDGIDIFKLKAQLDQQKVYVSIRGKNIRIAPNVYNEAKDVERLLGCLKNTL